MSPHHETHGVASKSRTSQLKPFTQKYKYKGKIVITNNDKITTISPKKQPYESMTLVKRIQQPKNGYLCIDLNSLSVVEEHCINEEA